MSWSYTGSVSPTPTRPTGQLPVSGADDERQQRSRHSVNVTWWYTFATSVGIGVFLLTVVGSTVAVAAHREGAPVWQIVAVAIVFGLTMPACVWATWLWRDQYGTGWPKPVVTVAFFAVPVIGWFLTLGIPRAPLFGALPLWLILNIVLPLLRPGRRLPWGLAGLVAVVGHGVLHPSGQDVINGGGLVGVVLLLIMCPATYLFSAWWWRIVVNLDEARRVHSELAVARERLRFASDLHDIQGHHLQVIALKAELASRLLDAESDDQCEIARHAVHDVRALAEQAQQETRALVRDLRAVSLNEELDNARDVLEAAGVTTTMSIAPAQVSPASERLMGMAVREATTNILRHADATRVEIHLTQHQQPDLSELELTISNDGIPTAPSSDSAAAGSGLSGLHERFDRIGGSVQTWWEPTTEEFHLTAVLPFLTFPEEPS